MFTCDREVSADRAVDDVTRLAHDVLIRLGGVFEITQHKGTNADEINALFLTLRQVFCRSQCIRAYACPRPANTKET